MIFKKDIYCCACKKDVPAHLVGGSEVYPWRKDLALRRFWKCPTCKNFVGCHNGKTNKPLGVIATQELKDARIHIHTLLDGMWSQKRTASERKRARAKLYNALSIKLGYVYHTAEIRTIEEARKVYRALLDFQKCLAFTKFLEN